MYLIDQAGFDRQRLREGAVNRAFVGNFQQTLALFRAQLTVERDLALDTVARYAVDLDLVV